MMNRYIMITIGLVLGVGHFSEGHGAEKEDMIEAFKNDAVIQAQVDNVRRRLKPNHEEYHVVPLGGGCGVRGCSFRDLVVMHLEGRHTNAQAASVLAVIEGFNSRINKVTLVELMPKQDASVKQSEHTETPSLPKGKQPSNMPLEPSR